MLTLLFWLIVGLIIGTLVGGVIFVVGMALVYLVVIIIDIFDWFETSDMRRHID